MWGDHMNVIEKTVMINNYSINQDQIHDKNEDDNAVNDNGININNKDINVVNKNHENASRNVGPIQFHTEHQNVEGLQV